MVQLSGVRAVLSTMSQQPDFAVFTDLLTRLAGRALARDGAPEHLTASLFVLDPTADRVLLTLHRKGRFWVQFGGHLEPGDDTLAAAALREGREESGIAALELLGEQPVDLDRHDLHSGFSCATHFDVGFVALADPAAGWSVSTESEDVGWWPVGALPSPTPQGFATRLDRVLTTVRRWRGI